MNTKIRSLCRGGSKPIAIPKTHLNQRLNIKVLLNLRPAGETKPSVAAKINERT